MISKIAEEILGMEKVAVRVGNLSGENMAWKVYVYPETHKDIHVHIKGPGGEEYRYNVLNDTYRGDVPDRDLREEIRTFCSNKDNLKKIIQIYNNGRGGQ